MQKQTSDSHLFFQTGGSLSTDFPTYVTRPADHQLYKQLKAGRFCFVLTARQMGKSSLRVRVAERLRKEGVVCASVDITKIGNRNSTPDQWYYSMLHEISGGLGIRSKLRTWWKENLGLTPVYRFVEFLEHVCLTEIHNRIIVFLDEIDAMLDLDKQEFSTADFFAVIRNFYNARVDNPELNRLTFAFFGVAAPNDLMRDSSRTPFNIGESINLQNFTYKDSKPLLRGFQHLTLDKETLLKEILDWTDGHPYLTQKLCYSISNNPEPNTKIKALVQDKVMELFLSSEVQSESNLSNVNNRILKNKTYNAEMLIIFQQILSGEQVRSNNNEFAQIYLKLSGLVKSRNGNLCIDNRIYQSYFNQEWVESAFREIERPFAEALQRWLKLDKSADAALRGDALDEAVKWARGRNDLSPFEYEFLEFSRTIQQAQAESAKKRLLWISSSLFFLALIALIASGIAFWRTNQAERARMEAELNAEEAKRARMEAELNAEEAKRQRNFAQQETERANQQRQEALMQQQRAQKNEEEAIRQRAFAVAAAEEARLQQIIADSLRIVADTARKTEKRLRLRDITRYLVTQTHRQHQLDMDTTGALLALQANNWTDGRIDAQIYEALRQTLNGIKFEAGGPTALLGHRDGVRSVAYSPDGKMIASGSDDGDVRIWNPKKLHEPPKILSGHKESVRSIAFNPEGDILASGSDDHTVRLWDLGEYKPEPRVLNGHKGPVWALAFSGLTLATGSADSTVQFWNLNNLNAVSYDTLKLKSRVRTVVFNSDGRWLAAGGDDGTIGIWKMQKNGPLLDLEHKHTSAVRSLAFSRTDSLLACGMYDGRVILWSLSRSGEKPKLRTKALHAGPVNSVRFSSDGRLLASASSDKTIRLWDLHNPDTDSPIILQEHRSWVWSIAFSRDGETLVSGSADKTVRIWITDTDVLANKVCKMVSRNLTLAEWEEFVPEDMTYERTCENLPRGDFSHK